MNIEEYRDYCIQKKGVTESFPFPKNLPNVLVFKVGEKMFTATDISTYASITVKCNPEKVDELRAKYPAVTPPVYMSKKHWNSVVMDNSIPDSLLYQWIDDSYDLVVKKLTKKIRLELGI
ncbi:MmcQ/YjbR family DNA-binding protein [Galbibacter sp. EGI 63066]|uniref:MmcQ/YjbR family DNA-binding protein n=1 Tax=Galbibacter sp. EGI 63066 TaxID=2993559 RepID=UPI00224967C5|nr:MmcQ/YjbR family DNA-binding protein [Galbibacter sp. EGI 63066]MCX2680809.1 MmcQ/YjbR family DNA-binding protein [Galbibacter sp. EGI 63066]